MYYKNRNLLHNQKIMYNELEDNKTKLYKYQKELNQHFTNSIELLNKMADNYRHLYHNIKKSANFFLPNIHTQDHLYTFRPNYENIDNEQLPTEIPKDYSDHTTEHITKKI